MVTPSKHQTAAVLVIGNEILSGRTRDANAWLAAQKLFARGCRLAEIAVIPDVTERIISTLNRLRGEYDAVITSGGIGPTHDDITMDAVARAFEVELIEHRHIVKAMSEYYGKGGLTDGRRRMSRVPKGATLVRCGKSIAPGAHVGNVYVLAGVPDIFASQLDSILEDFGGAPFLRSEIEVQLPESSYAFLLEAIQQRFPHVEIGSYPSRCGNMPCAKICLSSQDAGQLDQARQAVQTMLTELDRT